MHRLVKVAASTAATFGLALTGVAVAQPADAASPPLNGVDAQFLRGNEQVNLAEITLGTIVLKREAGPAARYLARRTIADHLVAGAANTVVARQAGVYVPRTPTATNQQLAAALMKAPRINLQYFTAQVAGHKQSIAATQYEIAHGIRPRVVAYAKYYLPVAEMHLVMAEHDLAVWKSLHPGQ